MYDIFNSFVILGVIMQKKKFVLQKGIKEKKRESTC
jgi:hypothetical protein